MYYDKSGKEIDIMEWVKLLRDKGYQIIKQDTAPNGKFVSTVWLGMNHQFGEGKLPLIFETMVFEAKGKWSELDMCRYSTLEEAEQGHKDMVIKNS